MSKYKIIYSDFLKTFAKTSNDVYYINILHNIKLILYISRNTKSIYQ